MATTKRRIHSKGPMRQEEFVAGEAGIYPGMLCEMNSSSQLIKHDDEGGRGEFIIAIEDVLQGNTVATVYTSGAIVTAGLPSKGSEVNVLIEDGQDISAGDPLISAGNGKFKKSSDLESGETLDQVMCYATEDCDLTGSNSSDTLCGARVA